MQKQQNTLKRKRETQEDNNEYLPPTKLKRLDEDQIYLGSSTDETHSIEQSYSTSENDSTLSEEIDESQPLPKASESISQKKTFPIAKKPSCMLPGPWSPSQINHQDPDDADGIACASQ